VWSTAATGTPAAFSANLDPLPAFCFQGGTTKRKDLYRLYYV